MSKTEWYQVNGSVIFERPKITPFGDDLLIGPCKSWSTEYKDHNPFWITNGGTTETESPNFQFSLPIKQVEYIEERGIEIYDYMRYYQFEVLDFVTLLFKQDEILDFNIWGYYDWEFYIEKLETKYSYTNFTKGIDSNFNEWVLLAQDKYRQDAVI